MKKNFAILLLILPIFSCMENQQGNRISKESYIANLLKIKALEKEDSQDEEALKNKQENQNKIVNFKNESIKTEFVTGSEDIPVLEGLSQTEDESFNLGFDSESGSIASSSYLSKIPEIEIRNFYLKTLPQMGWVLLTQNQEHLIFKRENKTVDIGFLNKDGEDLVQFFISSEL